MHCILFNKDCPINLHDFDMQSFYGQRGFGLTSPTSPTLSKLRLVPAIQLDKTFFQFSRIGKLKLYANAQNFNEQCQSQ